MAYRDDTQQLKARIEALEGELAEARDTIARLERGAQGKGGVARTLLGGPTALTVERHIDGEVDESIHEEVVEMLRRRFGVVGQVTTLGRSLGWTSAAANQRLIDVSVAPIGGRTVVRVHERLANLAGGLFGGVVGGVGGGGMGLVIPALVALDLRAFLPVGILLWLLAAYAATRAIYARIARKRELEIAGTADAIANLVSRATQRRVRLQEQSDPERNEAEAEFEAEAEDEKRSAETPLAGRRR